MITALHRFAVGDRPVTAIGNKAGRECCYIPARSAGDKVADT